MIRTCAEGGEKKSAPEYVGEWRFGIDLNFLKKSKKFDFVLPYTSTAWKFSMLFSREVYWSTLLRMFSSPKVRKSKVKYFVKIYDEPELKGQIQNEKQIIWGHFAWFTVS